jgi:hypothetical protein
VMRKIATVMKSATVERGRRCDFRGEQKRVKLNICGMKEARKGQKQALSFLNGIFDDASDEEVKLAKQKLRDQFLSRKLTPTDTVSVEKANMPGNSTDVGNSSGSGYLSATERITVPQDCCTVDRGSLLSGGDDENSGIVIA